MYCYIWSPICLVVGLFSSHIRPSTFLGYSNRIFAWLPPAPHRHLWLVALLRDYHYTLRSDTIVQEHSESFFKSLITGLLFDWKTIF